MILNYVESPLKKTPAFWEAPRPVLERRRERGESRLLLSVSICLYLPLLASYPALLLVPITSGWAEGRGLFLLLFVISG